MNLTERRTNQRVDLNHTIAIGDPQNRIRPQLFNVSQTGMLIVTNEPLRMGSIIDITLTGDGLKVPCRVSRVEPASRGRWGYGLETFVSDPGTEANFSAWLNTFQSASQLQRAA